MDDKGHAEVRATIPIEAGSEITDHYVTPLNGTSYRRYGLVIAWKLMPKDQNLEIYLYKKGLKAARIFFF